MNPCAPPWLWGWPTFVSPPWGNRPGWGMPWCGPGPAPWQTTEWIAAQDPWLGWTQAGGWRWPLDGAWQLARCAGGCPQGMNPGVCWWKGSCCLPGCPWLCRGCQAGWPFDGAGKHIGPAKYPAANRWDCNRVRWLGTAARSPRMTGAQARFLGAGATPTPALQKAVASQRGPAWAGQQLQETDLQTLYPRWVG